VGWGAIKTRHLVRNRRQVPYTVMLLAEIEEIVVNEKILSAERDALVQTESDSILSSGDLTPPQSVNSNPIVVQMTNNQLA